MLALMKRANNISSKTTKANLVRVGVVVLPRRNLGKIGEDVLSPHVEEKGNLDLHGLVDRHTLLKALDSSPAHLNLAFVIGFPAVLARPGSVVVEVKFLDTEHLPHLVGRSFMTKGNAQRLLGPHHVDPVQGKVSDRVVLIEVNSLMLNAILPLTAKDLRLYANSG